MSTNEQADSSRSNNTDLTFWHERWAANRIGFHRNEITDLFKKYLLDKLPSSSSEQQCVLFPLCGKSLDMKAVIDRGHRVIGVEGSRKAVESFYQENQIAYELETDEDYEIFKGSDRPITIYCGDFFKFNKNVPKIDWIWDRGGLVAVPPATRETYRDILVNSMSPNRTRLLLVAIEYEDGAVKAPPHRLTDDQMNELFKSTCSVQLMEAHDETEEYNARNKVNPVKYIEERLHLVIKNE